MPCLSMVMRSGPMPNAKPLHSVGIVAAVLQHDRMHHAAARDLQPAGVLAHAAARPAAQHTLDIHFHARLGEREVRPAEAHALFRAEHAPRELGDRAFQIGQADVAADGQPFDLIELDLAAGPRSARSGSTCPAGSRGSAACRSRRIRAWRGSGRAGVRPQDHARRRRVEGIPHIARGVVRRDIQQREVRLVVFHVAAAIDLEAHLGPDVVNLAQRLRGRMQPARLGTARPAASHRSRLLPAAGASSCWRIASSRAANAAGQLILDRR